MAADLPPSASDGCLDWAAPWPPPWHTTSGARAMPEPEDPITQLAAAAVQLHELYASYVEAGFTEQQAFELTRAILVASVGGNA